MHGQYELEIAVSLKTWTILTGNKREAVCMGNIN